jgi:hypothetical protein
VVIVPFTKILKLYSIIFLKIVQKSKEETDFFGGHGAKSIGHGVEGKRIEGKKVRRYEVKSSKLKGERIKGRGKRRKEIENRNEERE